METISNFSQKIYKKDSAGKVRLLHVYTEGADLIQESGILDGNLIEHRSTCVGKNIGRSNETTPEEQAQLEAKSKISTKMSTGYFNTVKDAQEKSGDKLKLPMLAKSYDTIAKKIDWVMPVFIQPKLDGMRCLIIIEDGEVSLITRKGKPIETMMHIIDAIKDSGLNNTTLDGELYAHGLTFQENMKIIKKYRPGESEKVCFHMYDIIEDASYSTRYGHLSIISKVVDSSIIELIDCYSITAADQIPHWHGKFLGQGYEGSIVRHSLESYVVNKRSSQLLKYKDFLDTTCTIKDVIPGEKEPTHGYFIFDWPGAKGHPMGDNILGCGMKFSHPEREKILINKADYIGETAELRFFEYTDDGIPRFPVCVGVRLDK